MDAEVGGTARLEARRIRPQIEMVSRYTPALVTLFQPRTAG
jgi:hypothetical protein